MVEHLHVDNLEFWLEVVCAHFLEGQYAVVGPSFGLDIAVCRPSEIQFARVRSSPQRFSRTEKHVRHSANDSVVLYLQAEGTGVQIQDGRELIIRPGDLVCADATRPTDLHCTGHFEQILLQIPRPLFVSALGPTERFTSLELSRRTPVGSVLAQFLKNIDSVLDDVSDFAALQLSQIAVSLAFTALADQSFLTLENPNWSRNTLLLRAKVFIRQHCQNPDLNPATIAGALKISVRYLQSIFQDIGTTPSDHIWECRLENSRRDLENPSFYMMSIGDIALKNGFANLPHFCNRFKERFGMSARGFRNSVRQLSSAVLTEDKQRARKSL